MAPISELSHLMNPLASSSQLEISSSQLDGVSRGLEDSIRYQTMLLLQAAGVLLRLPQELIIQAMVIQQRFWVGSDGGSMLEHDAMDVASAVLYLTAKISNHVVSPRQVITAFAFLNFVRPNYELTALHPDITVLVESQYEVRRQLLYEIESQVLRVLGFQIHAVAPHSLCINYLQALDTFPSQGGSQLAQRAFKHLNSAVLSPQLLYLTHQPSTLAASAIYLAARELDTKLPETEWWEVFDVDREELGFLAVALLSLKGFAQREREYWGKRRVPLTVEDLQAEIERRHMLELGT
ncbi:putative cyclin-L1-like protein, protein [Acrodontium crateriforme]|uniref:Cyclin-L1-like protein, protein n=1 Tax=Acrodontium crateriforme TaxID=150365 RepID=A0AAQ3M8F6_9PEZI|nr:putative cyclin-L1-like protein, protein [Acrodontium crateriforme]